MTFSSYCSAPPALFIKSDANLYEKKEGAIIRAQEKLLEAMPKPKHVKPTQPIRDVGKLHQAWSEAAEYHQRIAKQDALTAAVVGDRPRNGGRVHGHDRNYHKS